MWGRGLTYGPKDWSRRGRKEKAWQASVVLDSPLLGHTSVSLLLFSSRGQCNRQRLGAQLFSKAFGGGTAVCSKGSCSVYVLAASGKGACPVGTGRLHVFFLEGEAPPERPPTAAPCVWNGFLGTKLQVEAPWAKKCLLNVSLLPPLRVSASPPPPRGALATATGCGIGAGHEAPSLPCARPCLRAHACVPVSRSTHCC